MPGKAFSVQVLLMSINYRLHCRARRRLDLLIGCCPKRAKNLYSSNCFVQYSPMTYISRFSFIIIVVYVVHRFFEYRNNNIFWSFNILFFIFIFITSCESSVDNPPPHWLSVGTPFDLCLTILQSPDASHVLNSTYYDCLLSRIKC